MKRVLLEPAGRGIIASRKLGRPIVTDDDSAAKLSAQRQPLPKGRVPLKWLYDRISE